MYPLPNKKPLVAFGLLFVGIARIIHGITAKSISKWSRIFLLGVGILSLAVSFMVFASPLLGVLLLTFILAVNLLIIGIESIAYGIVKLLAKNYYGLVNC
jgi:uncharacterized membrane protein HdeD (DUF308 family)